MEEACLVRKRVCVGGCESRYVWCEFRSKVPTQLATGGKPKCAGASQGGGGLQAVGRWKQLSGGYLEAGKG